ncbi:MAG: efflux RND transporter periplasmic adaptor subunit [Fimbriiglobus sp.]
MLRRFAPLALLLPALTSLGCPTSKSASMTVASAKTEATINRVQPKRVNLSWDIEQPGSVMAFESTPLVAKLPGFVKAMNRDLGDRVKAGEILAVLEIPELEREADSKNASVIVAEAEVEQARSSVVVASEAIISAEAHVTEAKAGLSRTQADYDRWESELSRVERMVSQKVIDAQTLDETKKQFRSAAAGREEVTAKVNSAEAMKREANAKKLRAEADLKAAQAKKLAAEAEAKRVVALLEYRQIRAPYDGVVTGRFVHTGHYLQPGANRAEMLFTFARLDTVRVFIDVPEIASSLAVPGQKVVVRFPGQGGKEVAATITRTANVLTPDSRTLRTEIDLPNPDGTLKPGSYVVVKLQASAQEALTVPQAAVLFADETAYVYAIQEGKARKMRVQVGRNDASGVQLLAWKRATINTPDWQPIRETDTLIIGNLGAIVDGQDVK